MLVTLAILTFCGIKVPGWLWAVGAVSSVSNAAFRIVERHQKNKKLSF